MSFQWIIDNAESISIRSRPTVAATSSLDGTYRSVSQGVAPWTFEVQLPQGPAWTEYRKDIATAEYLDRTTTANIQINTSGQSWLIPYQGNCANTSAVTASWTTGNTITLTGGQAASGFNFRAGDILQLGSTGSVYRVAADVAFNVNTVTLHRPLLESAGNATLIIGPAVTWSVRCADFPQWTIFARDQISWSGAFVFVEDLT
jgi:hypothetical protein